MKHPFIRFHGVIFFVATIAIFGVVVMAIWNRLMPEIFGLPTLDYRQATGLLVLARIFFGGIGGWFPNGFHRNRLREKWNGMGEAEKEAFTNRFRHGFHEHDHRSGEDKNEGVDEEVKKD